MYFFNDECDFVDDDQYDLFTQGSEIERRQPRRLRSHCKRIRGLRAHIGRRGLELQPVSARRREIVERRAR